MNEAALLMELFAGSDMAHGRSELTGQVTGKGKHEAKSWLEPRPAELKDWEAHVEGRRGIGMSPLNSRNEVRWGAIDIDLYGSERTLENVNKQIQDAGLPLVVCRSKSGGPHVFLFLQEWMAAKLMIEKLEMLAGWLGFGDSEIFPKQAMISNSDSKTPDFGSWINMPYFGGVKFMRYGIDHTNAALPDIPSFVAYARSKALTKAQFMELSVPKPSEEPLPEGPPCLNRLFEKGTSEMRNVILSNCAVWAKKANPEKWQDELDRLNRLFPEPLPSGEVEAIKKSYSKKDYRYQCSKQPLCSFCDSSTCKRRKFGIGGGDYLPSWRSLTKVDTNPPVWYLDITMPDGNDKRISLTTEQLQNPRLFQRRCMEAIHKCPPLMKHEQWEPILQQMLDHVSVISIPPEITPEGMLIELCWDFLTNRAETESYDDLLRGLPHLNAQGYNFRMRDLMKYLSDQRFVQLRPHEITAVIRDKMGGIMGRTKKIKGKCVNYVIIPARPEDRPEPLDVTKQTSAF